jgi:alpha-D-ribose 1-methylphosphonate 5-triphosphate synthase subunit PhnG
MPAVTQISEQGTPQTVAAGRRAAMAVLASSTTAEIAARIGALGPLPAHEDLRRAEAGLVMLRGRIGGDGAPFNVGEVTVARAAVRLVTAEVGFGYVLGRDCEKARLIALCDALIQSEPHREAVEREVIAPIRRLRDARRTRDAERIAATRVEFFTLVRGEDA